MKLFAVNILPFNKEKWYLFLLSRRWDLSVWLLELMVYAFQVTVDEINSSMMEKEEDIAELTKSTDNFFLINKAQMKMSRKHFYQC